MSVNPFEVKGEVDYNRLIEQFGASPVTKELIDRFERVTGSKAHIFLRRGIIISHRDFGLLLDHYEKGLPIYIYTGRGASSDSIHIGHYIPLSFTKYLQDVFKAKVVIQMTNDEKYLFKNMSLEEVQRMTIENIKDIIAIGFNPDTTFIFDNISYIGKLYPNVLKIQKAFTINKLQSAFGFNNSDNVGKYAFPAIQMAPCFYTSFPKFLKEMNNGLCLVPQAIDQDNYFRLIRDISETLGYRKPVCMHSRFLPSLFTGEAKMSASSNQALYMNATKKQIQKAVNASVSGGGDTLELHRLHGANLEKDIPYQYLSIFLEDDNELLDIGNKYRTGELLTGEVKKKLVDILVPIFEQFQLKRTTVDIAKFMNKENL
jgi:tryptophanyl-tRNA synthetase